MCKLPNCKFPLFFSITHNPLVLMGISEYGTVFSQIGNMEEGRSACCSLEHSQVNTVDLPKFHFGTALRESFTLLLGRHIEDCSLFSGRISFYRIKKYAHPGAEIPRHELT